jgi:hypothetical protein
MSTVETNLVQPSTGVTLTLGGSGDTVAVGTGASTSGFDSGLASVQTFTSSGTWTRPSGITKVIMELQGAGGSGSAHSNYNNGAGGGYAKKLLDVSSISTSTITTGAGGASVGAGGGAGNNGGLSSWADGTNTVTGNGGLGGSISANTPVAGGTGVGGDINIQGDYGEPGAHEGGNSMFGFGRPGSVGGEVGVGYGAGGTHGHSSYASGAGTGGIVLVWEYK